MNYWFIRSPYKTRSWDDILLQDSLKLYGIRSYPSRKNISLMKPGDLALWYSSVHKKSIYGILKVISKPYPDPTSSDDWLAIDLKPKETFEKPITITDMKKKLPELKILSAYRRNTIFPLSKSDLNAIINLT